MKQKLLFLVFAIMASLGNMSAWDYEHVLIGDLYYNLNASDLTAEVTFDDDYYSNYPGLTKAYISSTTTYNGQEYKITSIGDGAFKNSHLTYVLIGSNVTSIGWMAFESCSSLPSVYIPKNVTSIGARAFWGCSSLTSVTIPSSVTSIGNAAFYGCRSLTKVTIPNKVTSIGAYTFHGCSSLTSVTIPNGVTSIGNYAFHYCCSLTSVTIPNSVTSIGDYAFYECSGLTSLTIPNSVTEIGKYAFASCGLTSLTISNSVTSIGDFAFCGSKITSVTIPNSVTRVGEGVFSSCINLTSVVWNAKMTNDYSKEINPFYEYTGTTIYHDIRKNIISFTFGDEVEKIPAYLCKEMTGLTSITIPANVTSIGDYAFENCKNITSVVWNVRNSAFWDFGSQVESFTFGDEVEVIPGGLCSGMNKLTSIIIPNSVTSIGIQAFYDCSSLTSVDIPNSVTDIGDYAFRRCSSLTSISISNSIKSIGYGTFQECSSLTAIAIPNSAIYIGDSAFRGCSNLTSVDIPNSVIDVGNSAFYGCSGLTSITIGHSVTEIGDYAFFGCSGLTSVTIPNSVTGIWRLAFSGCNGLNAVTMEPTTPPSMHGTAFDMALPKIYVPCGSLNAYKTATGWSSYSSQLQYAPAQYTITFIESNNGHYKYPPSSICDNEFAAIPNEGYHFVSWADGNTDNPRSIELTQDTVMEAIFAINTYNVTVTYNHDHGTVTGETGVFEHFSEITYEAIPNYGYYFSHWSDGKTANPRTITITGNTELTAIFEPNQYHISASCDQSQGSITGVGSYPYKSICSLEAVSNYGYHFSQWTDGVTDNPRSFILTQDTTFAAKFAPNQYHINVSCDNNIGTIAGENGIFDYLTERTYEAIPNYGYHFVRWSDGETANPRIITITDDTELTAIFELNQYCISVSCDQAQGSITGAGSYPYKSNCTIEAVPNYGYHFNQWKDGVMDNPRSFVLTQDTTFVAEFALNQYSINVSCDNNMGIVVGENGIFDYLTERTYEAIPNYGYHFVRWSDGETANPRTITLVKDITLSAEFSINLYNVQFFGYEEVLLDQQLVEHGKGAIAPDAPIIKNYEFVGWDKDFSNVQSDLDIHAKYVKTIDGIEDICTDEITMQKVLINGQLFILRGDKTYTVQGQEVR